MRSLAMIGRYLIERGRTLNARRRRNMAHGTALVWIDVDYHSKWHPGGSGHA